MPTSTQVLKTTATKASGTAIAPRPQATSNEASQSMIATFTILGLILLAIPALCCIIVLIGKLKQRKQGRVPTVRTVGENGRTVFRTVTPEESKSKLSAQPRSILPLTTQSATVCNPPRIAKAWARLSRPFSVAPAPTPQDDEIELRPQPSQASRNDQAREGRGRAHNAPVSPASLRNSFDTIDALEHGPVSPVSIVSDRHHGSRQVSMAAVMHQKNPFVTEPSAEDLAHIPLTPPANRAKRPSDDLRSRATSGNGLGMRTGSAATSGNITSTIVDANSQKVSRIQLGKVPKRR